MTEFHQLSEMSDNDLPLAVAARMERMLERGDSVPVWVCWEPPVDLLDVRRVMLGTGKVDKHGGAVPILRTGEAVCLVYDVAGIMLVTYPTALKTPVRMIRGRTAHLQGTVEQ